jgi:hypothetical protein
MDVDTVLLYGVHPTHASSCGEMSMKIGSYRLSIRKSAVDTLLNLLGWGIGLGIGFLLGIMPIELIRHTGNIHWWWIYPIYLGCVVVFIFTDVKKES